MDPRPETKDQRLKTKDHELKANSKKAVGLLSKIRSSVVGLRSLVQDFKLPVSRLIRAILMGSVLVALLAYIYYPTFAWMIERWTERDSYYGHGFLIPLVSLYWIWGKRRKIADGIGAAPFSWFGISLLVVAASVQIAACVLRFYFLSALSFVFLLLAGIYFLFGRKVFREVWFPIAFLFLMVPLPLLVIAQVTLKFKFWVAEISAHLVSASGIHAVREGSYIYMPHSVLLVGDPCSGLRSFLAFLCLGIVFAYDEKLAMWKRAVLVAAGLPLAILSNIARVYFLALVAEVYGMEHTGPGSFPHDASGIAVFVIAFLVFLVIRKKLERIHA